MTGPSRKQNPPKESLKVAMHVVHTIPAMFKKDGGIVGGAERYVHELARFMAKLTQTTLLSFGPKRERFQIGELKFEIYPTLKQFQNHPANPFGFSIAKTLAKADVIHCHQRRIVMSSYAALVGRILGKRVVVSDLGGDMWDLSYKVPIHWLYQGNLHISRFSRDIHREMKWTAKPHYIIYGGVDTEKFRPAARPPRDYFLFVGRLRPLKGVNYFVEAAQSDLSARVVGQPYDLSYFEYLKSLVKGNNVEFLEDCTDERMMEMYQNAAAIVLPSVYEAVTGEKSKIPEFLGQTLMEGMACGTPAICSNVASMPEIVVDGECGFVVEPNSAKAIREKLLWLKEHPKEAADMGARARKRVMEKFRWEPVVRNCLEIYAGRATPDP